MKQHFLIFLIIALALFGFPARADVTYYVELESATIDTGINPGVQIQSFIWNGSGTDAFGTNVSVSFATSKDSEGPWDFVGGYGGVPGASIAVSPASHPAGRYLRYRVGLFWEVGLPYPLFQDITIHWSP